MMLEVISADVVARGDRVVIKGDEDQVNALYRTLEELVFLYREGSTITESQVRIAAKLVANGKADAVHTMFEDTLSVNMRGKNITPKTEGQKYYVDSIRKNTITFGIGPAGTGKTFLAVALAAFYLKNRNVDKIILTRPAVEAGERLGCVPGELQDKVDPYLRPLYDALHEMFGIEQVQRFMERGTIEVAPLAYMRGRTLENAFVILDEAQNTTAEQMKMFLTRLGNNSKMVVNGDKTQIDEGIQEDSNIEAVIRKVCDEVSRVYGLDEDEMSILLCNNAKIHELNKEYRGIDRPTDVLSFALNEGDDYEGSEEEHHLLGDMIISLERTREQAIEYGHSFERELAYLTTHSCLHILGYDHMNEEDKKEMRTEEEFILGNLGYVREDAPYNE